MFCSYWNSYFLSPSSHQSAKHMLIYPFASNFISDFPIQVLMYKKLDRCDVRLNDVVELAWSVLAAVQLYPLWLGDGSVLMRVYEPSLFTTPFQNRTWFYWGMFYSTLHIKIKARKWSNIMFWRVGTVRHWSHCPGFSLKYLNSP